MKNEYEALLASKAELEKTLAVNNEKKEIEMMFNVNFYKLIELIIYTYTN